MDSQTRKKQLLKRIEAIEDTDLLKVIDSVLDSAGLRKEGKISVKEYNQELEAADSNESGEYLLHKEVEDESKSWLT